MSTEFWRYHCTRAMIVNNVSALDSFLVARSRFDSESLKISTGHDAIVPFVSDRQFWAWRCESDYLSASGAGHRSHARLRTAEVAGFRSRT
jgi:hypothetical protein